MVEVAWKKASYRRRTADAWHTHDSRSLMNGERFARAPCRVCLPTRGKKNREIYVPLQNIAHRGACHKSRVLLQHPPPLPEPAKKRES
jgi:hypothetical protein